MGYSPWDYEQSDIISQLSTHIGIIVRDRAHTHTHTHRSRSVMSDSLRPHELHAAYQSPLSLGFSRQEYWSGLTFPSPGYLRNPEIELLVSRIAVRRFTI